MNTTKPASDIRIDIDNLSADVDRQKVAFRLMMGSHNNAMMAPATSEEQWDHKLLRNSRQEYLVKNLDEMISELQGIRDSVENLWS